MRFRHRYHRPSIVQVINCIVALTAKGNIVTTIEQRLCITTAVLLGEGKTLERSPRRAVGNLRDFAELDFVHACLRRRYCEENERRDER